MTRPTAYKKRLATKTMAVNNGGEALDDARVLAIIDENQRLREIINCEPTITATLTSMLYEMIIVRGVEERYAVETAGRMLGLARRVRG